MIQGCRTVGWTNHIKNMYTYYFYASRVVDNEVLRLSPNRACFLTQSFASKMLDRCLLAGKSASFSRKMAIPLVDPAEDVF